MPYFGKRSWFNNYFMTNADLPILYSFRRCPYAIRARMALVYCDIKVELREVDLNNKPNELIKISSKATVPVLLFRDGCKLEESLDIINWAMSVQDKDRWLVLDKKQKMLANLLINENDTEFKLWLDKYKYSQRFPEYSEIYYRQQGELFLNKLNELLTDQQYLIRNNLTYVDIALAPFIRQFSNVDLDWFRNSKYQFLVPWLENILDSTIFIKTMQKYPVWDIGNKKSIFP